MFARCRVVLPVLLALTVGASAQPLEPPVQPLDTVYQFVVATYAPVEDASSLTVITTDNAPVYVIDTPDSSEDAGVFMSPGFGEFGEVIVYSYVTASTPPQLYTTGSSGVPALLIDDAARAYEQPAFSPDSTKLTFVVTAEDNSDADLYVADADGSNIVQLTATPDIAEYDAVWSPDGLSLAYLASDESSTSIMTITADGGEALTVYESETPPASLGWSTDGILYFAAQVTENGSDEGSDPLGAAIYAVPADGSGNPELVFMLQSDTDTAASIDAIRLSPDGLRIAYVQTEFRPGASGGIVLYASLHILDIPTGTVFTPDWDFGGALITGFDWR